MTKNDKQPKPRRHDPGMTPEVRAMYEDVVMSKALAIAGDTTLPPANLPAVQAAKLPATYEAAKVALATCERIDECREWADKAQALASYAKQAHDAELRHLALRIQTRAIRRCGELLRQIERRQGARTDLQPLQAGALPKLTRQHAARDAGMSEHQAKTAIRVANIPAGEFERVVESTAPPTVTALAERGKVVRVIVRPSLPSSNHRVIAVVRPIVADENATPVRELLTKFYGALGSAEEVSIEIDGWLRQVESRQAELPLVQRERLVARLAQYLDEHARHATRVRALVARLGGTDGE